MTEKQIERKVVKWRVFIAQPENERKPEDIAAAWADFIADKLAEKDSENECN